jgi:Xaa-Pro aminopeptidase
MQSKRPNDGLIAACTTHLDGEQQLSSASVFKTRMQKLRKSLVREGLDGVVLAPGPNTRYYTDVQSQMLERLFLLFVPQDGDAHLVAPNIEAGPYARSPVDIQIHSWDDAGGPSRAFASLRKEVGLRGKWGCEGRVPFGYLTQIADKKLALDLADPLLQAIRQVKDASELAALRRAAKILGEAYLKIPEIAKAGASELEVAKALREEIFAHGGETVDFCSVQAGKNAADPHWAPSPAKLRNNEGFLIDTCCTVSGYSADITRTFVLGKAAEVEEAYLDVLEAQKAAVKSVGPGVATGEVDAAARSRLEAAGRGKEFFHRTGHGLGLEIHEEPYIVSGGRKKLKPGMVFTVEPGVYVEGRYGVRIEDDVFVTADGVEVVTGMVPKEFGWWK